jgi:hypothetical protein
MRGFDQVNPVDPKNGDAMKFKRYPTIAALSGILPDISPRAIGGAVHCQWASRGSGDELTVLLITYADTPGVPTSIPAKGEKAEY